MPLEKISERTGTNEPHLLEDEQIRLAEKNCGVSVLCGPTVSGDLYLTTKRLIWLSAKTEVGFAVDYPYIGLHALSRAQDAFPHACIYCHLQSAGGLKELGFPEPPPTAMNDAPSTNEEESSDVEGYSLDVGCEPPGEVRFVPSDEAALEKIFKVMTDMAALNPDPDDSDSDNDASDNMAAMMMPASDGQNVWDPANEEYQEDDEECIEEKDLVP